MNQLGPRFALLLWILFGGWSSALLPAQSTEPAAETDDAKPLDAALSLEVDRVLAASDDPRKEHESLWRDTIMEYGQVDPLLEDLKGRLTDAKESDRLPVARLLTRLQRRLGDLSDALDTISGISVEEESIADCLEKAEILDALGKNDQAVEAYTRLLTHELDEDLRNRALLRQALMRKTEPKAAGGETDSADEATGEGDEKEKPLSPLATFALEECKDPALRNQAAIVLALKDEQKAALDVFGVTGEATKRFRQEIRLAEWALEAELWERAQKLAWDACSSAKLKRDRRYGLTLLVEAYRRDEALEELIDRFAAEKNLSDEARQVWIDLLRETGQVEEAIRLFRSGGDSGFSIDMRRELLELCRESGQEKILVDAYRKLVAEEPRFIEWREGLSRYYLERGNRPSAVSVWQDYLTVTEDHRYRMAAAATLRDLGLDDLSIEFARECMKTGDDNRDEALLFLLELHMTRGRLDEAEAALLELDQVADPRAAVRQEMSEAYARLGNKKRAVEVLEKLREARGEDASPDSGMKLAFLLSEIGEEERALGLWEELWLQIDSIPRRRYVEERMMTVASRLGTLARIAVDLERKLSRGEATDRESGLLVRLYTRVNDPVSATEVVEEYMGKSGGKPAEVLKEKSRIFLACQDYYNYEKVIQELIEVDPDGAPDYLRQLAMSNLERGQRDDARVILERLKKEDADTASLEFEAGVLSLAGMRDEALAAYRRSLARYPERIDTYLLLSNIMKELGQHERSAAMFQYLAETAEKDDLFTIAIDGLLNMRDGRANRGAPNRLIEWARRVTLERLARRPSKLYLHQLVADLSDELSDKGMGMRALKAALPIAGEQRTSLLRELMTMAKPAGRSRPGMIMIGGPAREVKDQVNTEQLMFGRRLLGQGELVPPQVYLELGEAFLAAGEVTNATKTFNQASQLPEFAELQRDIAAAFKRARYPAEALRVYERLLSVQTSDIGLMLEVAELHEQLGRDDLATEVSQRGIALLISRRPFTKTTKKKKDDEEESASPGMMFAGRNVDEFDTNYNWFVRSLLATESLENLVSLLEAQQEILREELARAATEETDGQRMLETFPRISARLQFCRRLAAAMARFEGIDDIDRRLLALLPGDEKLLERACRYRLRWGLLVSARKLIQESDRPEEEKKRLRLLAGGGSDEELPGLVPIAEMSGLVLPLLVANDTDAVRQLLERMDLSTGNKDDLEHMRTLVSAVTYLKDSELALTVFRHWLNLLVQHQSGALYGAAEQVLRGARMVLDADQQRSLVEQLIDAVTEKPEKFTYFITRLPELQQSFDSQLMTTEQVESLIKSRLEGSDRFIYGIPELFVLIEPKDRPSVLRSVWPKVPKSQKSVFLLQLLPGLEEPVEPAFADFMVASFQEGIKDVDDPNSLSYSVDGLVEGTTNNLEVAIRFLEVLRKKEPQQVLYDAAHVLCLAKSGRRDEAFEEARDVYRELLDSPPKDYRSNSAIRKLLETFHEERMADFVAVLEEAEKKRGSDENLVRRRLDLVRYQEKPELELEILRKAVADFPEEASFLQRLRSFYSARGWKVQTIEMQQKLVDLPLSKDNVRTRLVRDWRSLRHPVNALAARKKTEEDKGHRDRQPRTPMASVAQIKKHLEKEDFDGTRVMFRRLWRVFPDRADRFYQYSYDSAATARHYWPIDVDETKKKKAYRGGLPEFKKRVEDDKNAEERKTVQEVLAREAFGESEIRRQLRSLSARQLNGPLASDCFQALAAVAVEREGRQAVMEGILRSEREGRAGKVDYGMLFALMESTPEAEHEQLGATLDGLMGNLNPADSAQLRRLARLYAKTGNGGHASVLYRWCATMQRGSSYYRNAWGLLGEVIDHLDGEARDLAVEDVLRFGDPGEDSFWGRDGYERLVLDTWDRLLGPEGALERAREICDRMTATGNMPRREAAAKAAYLLARAGEHEAAAGCLEIALCKLEAPANLKYPWYRTYFENPGRVTREDMIELFPEDTAGWQDSVGWLTLCRQKVEEWREADRVAERTAFEFQALIALRLHQAGETDAASDVLEGLAKHAEFYASRELWLADLYRRLGDEEQAHAIELRLLEGRRLHVERVPEVVGRVLEEAGAEAALALGVPATKYTLHPDLLDHLVAACTSLGRSADAERWVALKKEAEQAEEKLKEVTQG